MTPALAEVINAEDEKFGTLVQTEFKGSPFFIVGRTLEYFVVGNGTKNVKFCRIKHRVLERREFEQNKKDMVKRGGR
ncbi:MAG: hypothetical protein WCY93_08635 [Anaerolineaceae bacterium]